ncbi:MAG: hypothetical protein VB093_04070 [Propionicimonas sp.]|nr:hypothetical protein [Propionicimonas sp.]
MAHRRALPSLQHHIGGSMRFRSIVLAAAVLPLAIGGCQQDRDLSEPPPATASDTPPVVLSAPETAAPPDPGSPATAGQASASIHTDVPEDFPLVPYWGAIRRGKQWVSNTVSEDVRINWESREAAVAGCMKDRGFLYDPRPWTTGSSAPDVEDRDYLAVPRLPASRAEVQASGYGVEPRPADRPEQTDENQAYIDSLTKSELSAYLIAMYGVDTTAQDHDPYNQPEELGGCLGDAERTYPDPAGAHADRDVLVRFGDLVTHVTMQTRHGRVFEQQEIISLNREWRQCMAKAGFAIDDLPEGRPWDGPIQAYVRAQMTSPSGDVAEAGEGDTSVPDDQTRLVGSDPERQIALRDFDCREKTDYLSRFMQVQRELEQAFVDANRKELDKMVALVDSLG